MGCLCVTRLCRVKFAARFEVVSAVESEECCIRHGSRFSATDSVWLSPNCFGCLFVLICVAVQSSVITAVHRELLLPAVFWYVSSVAIAVLCSSRRRRRKFICQKGWLQERASARRRWLPLTYPHHRHHIIIIRLYIRRFVCLFVSLLITREQEGRLALNFRGSSRAPGDGFWHKKLGLVGRGSENLHYFGLGMG